MEHVEMTIRVTHQEAEENHDEIHAFLLENPEARLVISDDTSCPHCAAAGIEVTDDGWIVDVAASQNGNRPVSRQVRRQAERAARKRRR